MLVILLNYHVSRGYLYYYVYIILCMMNDFCPLSYRPTECNDGKFEHRCETVCPFPWYGRLCVSKCNCTQDYCDPIYGCFGKCISFFVSF